MEVLARGSCPYVFDCDVCTYIEADVSPCQSAATRRVQDKHTSRLSAQSPIRPALAMPLVRDSEKIASLIDRDYPGLPSQNSRSSGATTSLNAFFSVYAWSLLSLLSLMRQMKSSAKRASFHAEPPLTISPFRWYVVLHYHATGTYLSSTFHQWGENPALRSAGLRADQLPVPKHDPGSEGCFEKCQQAFITHPTRYVAKRESSRTFSLY